MDDREPGLWRISAFERERAAAAAATTLLPTTLLADLRRMRPTPGGGQDVLEVAAACVRHRESALLYLGCGPLVWPVTLFPAQALYHSPRAADDEVPAAALPRLRLLSAERSQLRPPGHFEHDRIGHAAHYRPLPSLLWALAVQGPRQALLDEIPADARYRLAAGVDLRLARRGGALGPSIDRLRAGAATLRDMSGWPGMGVERASRLLNALYLTGSLMILRAPQPGPRPASSLWWPWLSRRG
ncbi:MAG: hypothetical protein HYZ20_09245 [Burkholderiales bacterium]|nr:hypothetical protein [Burkholderiales bacterium]